AAPRLLRARGRRGWAPTHPDAGRDSDAIRLEEPVALLLIGAVGLLLLLALITKVHELRLKRDGEVIAVKGVISDALGADPELFGLPLTATVRVPLWRGAPG